MVGCQFEMIDDKIRRAALGPPGMPRKRRFERIVTVTRVSVPRWLRARRVNPATSARLRHTGKAAGILANLGQTAVSVVARQTAIRFIWTTSGIGSWARYDVGDSATTKGR
jgi:hypothetical protein